MVGNKAAHSRLSGGQPMRIPGGIWRRRTSRRSFTRPPPCCWRRKGSPSPTGSSSATYRPRDRPAVKSASRRCVQADYGAFERLRRRAVHAYGRVDPAVCGLTGAMTGYLFLVIAGPEFLSVAAANPGLGLTPWFLAILAVALGIRWALWRRRRAALMRSVPRLSSTGPVSCEIRCCGRSSRRGER